MKRYVITDIHGCARTFRSLLGKLRLRPEDHLYLLGDYIDRGPDSKGVLDLIMELSAEGYYVYPLRGNHEQFLLDSISDRYVFDNWAGYNGGHATLKSFGVALVREIPEKYLSFLAALPYYITLDDYYLVHAGFNFDLPDPFGDREAMLFIRDFPVSEKDLGGRKILHGHTPTPLDVIQTKIEEKEALAYNLDNGCVFRHRPGLGHLVALELNAWELFVQPNTEVVAG